MLFQFQTKPFTNGNYKQTPDGQSALDVFNALKALAMNDVESFVANPWVDVVNSVKIFGAYPEDKPYIWVCDQTDPTINNMEMSGWRAWFKKEHPLYKDHFIYVGLGVLKFNTCFYCIQTSVAEYVTPQGVVINECSHNIDDVDSMNVGSVNYCWLVDYDGWQCGPMNCGIYPALNSKARTGGYTLLIGNWGFGVYGQLSKTPRIPAVGNFQGALFLESLAEDLNNTSEMAFVPDNYPMAAFFHSLGHLKSGGNGYYKETFPRKMQLLRYPGISSSLKNLDSGQCLHSLAESVSAKKGEFDSEDALDANGKVKAQVFPVYLGLKGAMVAKLPILKPIIGSDKYTHVGKIITSEGKKYYGTFAINKPCGCTSSDLSNTDFTKLRAEGLNQEYLRMDE